MENATNEKSSASRTFDAEEVKSISRAAGADIVGIASAETLNAYPPDPRWPQTPEKLARLAIMAAADQRPLAFKQQERWIGVLEAGG